MKTIFVQIPSYRDPEVQRTVKDLFAKAAQPERVHVGICWQHDPDTDKDGFTDASASGRVRLKSFHWRESQGVCWARHQAQGLFDGEDYVLSIDSDMRLAPRWDEGLIGQLDECPSPKPVLSNHPAGYTPPDDRRTDATPTVLRAHPYSPQGDLRVRGERLDHAPKVPLRGAFCAGGFLFARGEVIREVPCDPYLYFDQEDIALSARLFTHGFDIYSLKNTLLYRRDGRAGAPLHRDDHPGWLKLQERGRKRLNHLLGYAPSVNPAIVSDLERYGLGTARSLADYESFCGIDFARRAVSDRAVRCGFIADLDRYLDGPIRIPELDDAAAKPEAPQAAPETAQTIAPAFDQAAAIERVIAANEGRALNIDRQAPEGVLVIQDYLDRKTCKMLAQYADSQTFTELKVVDPKSTSDKIIAFKHDGRVTHHVDIDGRALDILNIFNDVHCRQMAAFYDVDFEWYERPQILRYPPGGKYNRHADADHWVAEKNEWVRAQDRDYSVLVYLNDDYEGGELSLINQNFTIKPKPGMLLAFPSDHRYLHAALPTISGIRYVLVCWAAVIGSKRVRKQMPYGSVFVRQKGRA